MAPLNVAILGSGIFVKEQHKPAVLKEPSLMSLKAIWSRSKASVEATVDEDSASIEVYSEDSGPGKSLDDLLKRSDIDFVIIALPIVQQPEYIKQALTAGKHVLSEKPVAKDLTAANELLEWKKTNAPKLIWSVAENFRFMDHLNFAAQKVQEFGKILHFYVQSFGNVEPGGKYFETKWRKVPDYQGGFCLDGGVHFAAGLRLIVGNNNIKTLGAFTTLNQQHLLPIDTIISSVQLRDGGPGTFSLTFGSPSMKDVNTFAFACEKGSVTVDRAGTVTVKPLDLPEETKKFTRDQSGVPSEVKAFAEAINAGKPNPSQDPELAIGDLEIIEKSLQSGEKNGQAMEINGGITSKSIVDTLAEKVPRLTT